MIQVTLALDVKCHREFSSALFMEYTLGLLAYKCCCLLQLYNYEHIYNSDPTIEKKYNTRSKQKHVQYICTYDMIAYLLQRFKNDLLCQYANACTYVCQGDDTTKYTEAPHLCI